MTLPDCVTWRIPAENEPPIPPGRSGNSATNHAWITHRPVRVPGRNPAAAGETTEDAVGCPRFGPGHREHGHPWIAAAPTAWTEWACAGMQVLRESARPIAKARAALSLTMSAWPGEPIRGPTISRRTVTGLSAMTCERTRRPLRAAGPTLRRKSGASTSSDVIWQMTTDACWGARRRFARPPLAAVSRSHRKPPPLRHHHVSW